MYCKISIVILPFFPVCITFDEKKQFYIENVKRNLEPILHYKRDNDKPL